jgi:hypothetical protein
MIKVAQRRLAFSPASTGWARTHGQNPFGQDLGGGNVRLHFACRDEQNRSHGASLDTTWDALVSAGPPLIATPRMTLDLGVLGAFDDSGAMPSVLVEKDGAQYLYYTGWSLAKTVPFSFHIGLAMSADGGQSFTRVSQAPVLGRNLHDPFVTAAPWVMLENGVFRMWYIAGTAWEKLETGVRHYYTVKYAESDDGIAWKTSDHRCIDYGAGEYALARPVVTRDGDRYRMLFSFRGGNGTYRIGSAVSVDGIVWDREDDLYLDVSVEGWDSAMVCYGWPFTHQGGRFLLYNGNDYGKDGFGVVRLG